MRSYLTVRCCYVCVYAGWTGGGGARGSYAQVRRRERIGRDGRPRRQWFLGRGGGRIEKSSTAAARRSDAYGAGRCGPAAVVSILCRQGPGNVGWLRRWSIPTSGWPFTIISITKASRAMLHPTVHHVRRSLTVSTVVVTTAAAVLLFIPSSSFYTLARIAYIYIRATDKGYCYFRVYISALAFIAHRLRPFTWMTMWRFRCILNRIVVNYINT